ncbi:sensor domain-containing diguanylate cyclase [Butyrivibrio sp. MC2013]|uniref:sensor domain-containing diguanylate cyclase n=1 Tax=Butyrivibrio sp. MC2013 TaxID=1280686 RepID=UPI00041D9981|nr:GGDEF domain-containing protein [Butyrivibrio sp. MC2013]
MARIGLLISELSDEKTCSFVKGMLCAAEEIGAVVIVMPGGTLYSPITATEQEKYVYQQNAIYNYITTDALDGLIIDINEIGGELELGQREEFLNEFRRMDLPFLLTAPMEKYDAIHQPAEDEDPAETGFRALHDILSWIARRELSGVIEIPEFPDTELTIEETMRQLSLMSRHMLNMTCDRRQLAEEIIKTASRGRIETALIFMYGEGQRHTVNHPWDRPENILVKGAVENGVVIHLPEGMMTPTEKLLTEFGDTKLKKGGWIARTLSMDDEQLGFIIFKFSPQMLTPGIEYLLNGMLHAAIQIVMRRSVIRELSEELLTVQEELERDDSVLDHIGEKDLLTGEYNRRGFFTHAYDRMAERFKKGNTAIVCYIDLDTIKNINDRFGRDEGNYAVKRVAKLIRDVFGKKALIGRIKGYEFAVMMITDRDNDEDYFRTSMMQQNGRLMAENDRPYIIHIVFAICSYKYDDHLSLRFMLRDTDEKLRKMLDMQADMT